MAIPSLDPLPILLDAIRQQSVEDVLSILSDYSSWFSSRSDLLKEAFEESLQNGESRTVQAILDAGVPGNERSAAMLGNIAYLESCDVHYRDDLGRTLLHYATFGQSERALEYLVSRAADVAVRDQYHETAFDYAISDGWTWGAIRLMSGLKKFRPDAALRAARLATPEVLAEMARRGQDLDVADVHGMTPLHYSARAGHVATTEWLIEYGLSAEALDVDGRSPLLVAVRFPSVADVLIRAGAPIGIHEASGLGLVDDIKRFADDDSMSVRSRTGGRESPMHFAFWADQREAAKALLQCGSYMFPRASDGSTPLDWAVNWKSCRVLQWALATTNILAKKSHMRERLLRRSAAAGNSEVAMQCLQAGASPDAVDRYGESSLHHAVRFGDLQLVRMIMNHGADLHIRSRRGFTPLDLAVLFGAYRAAKCLTGRWTG
ncbi:MAG: ankyrin repeat domain-containing protein [Planctomycetes bacterium]|nr:ankyrin repeat domain-containing protein [Planctomycetota bacterium]